MVNLFHFIGLDINEQAEYVWQGTFLATRENEKHKIHLYSLGDFYAEVFYNYNDNEIVAIKGFRSRSLLIPYLGVLR
jgi:hypothetical protein